MSCALVRCGMGGGYGFADPAALRLPLPTYCRCARCRRSAAPDPLHSLLPLAGKCKATGVDNVGTVPAALTTYLAIQAFRPDIVISTGGAAWVWGCRQAGLGCM